MTKRKQQKSTPPPPALGKTTGLLSARLPTLSESLRLVLPLFIVRALLLGQIQD